jgi:hypothetical protein
VTTDFEIHRIAEIVRQIETATVVWLRRHGYQSDIASGPPELAAAYATFHEELQALWRIVMYEARQARVSADDVRKAIIGEHEQKRPAVTRPRWTWPMLLNELQAHARDQLAYDATHGRQQRRAHTTGGKTRGTTIAKGAAANDTKIRRLRDRWRMSDELQGLYRSAAAYIVVQLGLPRKTVHRRLLVLDGSPKRRESGQ